MEDFVIAPESLLDEIQSETLQQLLRTIRVVGNYKLNDYSTLGPVFSFILYTEPPLHTGLSSLDECLAASSLDDPNDLRVSKPFSPGDVIEIQGSAASGKTHLIYQLLTRCILPPYFQDIPTGGCGKAAVVFDTDGTFDCRRFRDLLSNRLKNLLMTHGRFDDPSDILIGELQDAAEYQMRNMLICRVESSTHLAASLQSLPDFMATNEYFRDQELSLVVVDSLSYFYWKDKLTVEQHRNAGHTSDPSLINPLRHVLDALQTLKTTLNPIIVLSNWGLIPLRNLGESTTTTIEPSPFFRQHLNPFPFPFVQQPQPQPQPQSQSQPTDSNDNHIPVEQPLESNATEIPADESADIPASDGLMYDEVHEETENQPHLNLTHHITLSPIRPLFSSGNAQVPPQTTPAEDILVDTGSAVGTGEIQGFLRTIHHSQSSKFKFCITEEGITG